MFGMTYHLRQHEYNARKILADGLIGAQPQTRSNRPQALDSPQVLALLVFSETLPFMLDCWASATRPRNDRGGGNTRYQSADPVASH